MKWLSASILGAALVLASPGPEAYAVGSRLTMPAGSAPLTLTAGTVSATVSLAVLSPIGAVLCPAVNSVVGERLGEIALLSAPGLAPVTLPLQDIPPPARQKITASAKEAKMGGQDSIGFLSDLAREASAAPPKDGHDTLQRIYSGGDLRDGGEAADVETPAAPGSQSLGSSLRRISAVTGSAGEIQTGIPGFTLPVDRKPDFRPELIFSNDSVDKIAGELADDSTLVLADAHNFPRLEWIGKVIRVTDASVETVRRITTGVQEEGVRRVIGIGGCTVLDVARAVAVRATLFLMPTILSTCCISNNRSVLDSGLKSFSYASATSVRTIISLKDLLGMDAAARRHWTQSGMGDYFASISAAVTGKTSLETAVAQDPAVFAALDWVFESFRGYNDETSIRAIAEFQHNSGLSDIEQMTNLTRIDDEHAFYKALIELYPEIRSNGPSHGQIVSIGTLLAVKIFSKRSKDDGLYRRLHAAYDKLGLPVSYEGLTKIDLDKKKILSALQLMERGSVKSHEFGFYFSRHGYGILDEIFSARPSS
ncbi:MAG: iron-containing alcohol dehydrogenase [Elusimicrobiota bacterium]